MITEKQIQNLQNRQKCLFIHPFTCCSDNECNLDDNRLIPKEDKWYCPCGNYTQEYKGEENDTDWRRTEDAYADLYLILNKQNKS